MRTTNFHLLSHSHVTILKLIKCHYDGTLAPHRGLLQIHQTRTKSEIVSSVFSGQMAVGVCMRPLRLLTVTVGSHCDIFHNSWITGDSYRLLKYIHPRRRNGGCVVTYKDISWQRKQCETCWAGECLYRSPASCTEMWNKVDRKNLFTANFTLKDPRKT